MKRMWLGIIASLTLICAGLYMILNFLFFTQGGSSTPLVFLSLGWLLLWMLLGGIRSYVRAIVYTILGLSSFFIANSIGNGINDISPPEATRRLALGLVYSLIALPPVIDALVVLVDLNNPAYSGPKVAPLPSPAPAPAALSSPNPTQQRSTRSANTKILAVCALVVEVIIGLLGNLATGGVLTSFGPIWLLLIAVVAIGIILVMLQP